MNLVESFRIEKEEDQNFYNDNVYHSSENGKYRMGAMVIGHNPFIKVRSDDRFDEYESSVAIFHWQKWVEFRTLLINETSNPRILAALKELELIGYENFSQEVQDRITYPL